MTELLGPARGSRWRADSFRRSVLAFLSGSGLRGLTMRGTSQTEKLSAALMEERSDIRGLRDFSLLTQVDYKIDLSGALDRAVIAAEDDGKRWPVVVQWRKSREDAADTYCVMRLKDWSEMVQALEAAA